MKLLFLLSGEHIPLAMQEVINLLKIKKLMRHGAVLIGEVLNKNIPLVSRLGFSRMVLSLLFSCSLSSIKPQMEKIQWGEYAKGSFCLRIHALFASNRNDKEVHSFPDWLSEKKLAGVIWRSLKHPKVDLEHPQTKVVILHDGKKAWCGIEIPAGQGRFDERRDPHRPEPSPTTLHPKLARCMVNLTGIQAGKIVDPFCGAGGLLIEAGLMGLRPEGIDLYGVMVRKAKKNLDHYGIKDYQLHVGDALSLKGPVDYVVSDVPYGLNTSLWTEKDGEPVRISLPKSKQAKRSKDIKKFYLLFLKALRKSLRKRAVVAFPGHAHAEKLLRNVGFSIENKFSQRIHRSLTRDIFIFRP